MSDDLSSMRRQFSPRMVNGLVVSQLLLFFCFLLLIYSQQASCTRFYEQYSTRTSNTLGRTGAGRQRHPRHPPQQIWNTDNRFYEKYSTTMSNIIGRTSAGRRRHLRHPPQQSWGKNSRFYEQYSTALSNSLGRIGPVRRSLPPPPPSPNINYPISAPDLAKFLHQ